MIPAKLLVFMGTILAVFVRPTRTLNRLNASTAVRIVYGRQRRAEVAAKQS